MSQTYNDQSQISAVVTEPTSNHSDYHAAINGYMMEDIRSEPSRFSPTTSNRRSTHSEHRNTSYDYMMNNTPISQQSTNTAASESASTNSDNQVPQVEPLLYQEKLLTLPGWPTSPKPIKTAIYVKLLNGVFDVLLLTCSTAFLAFALIVRIHDQATTAENLRLTKTLLDATKYGPTVFPILFASVVGRAAHAILLWRLEKGESIGILDTLASSTSLTSTVTSQLQLRAFSLLGVALVAVWSLSPIGGQASVRIMTIGSQDTRVPESFSYMVNNGYLGAYTPADLMQQGQSSAGVVFVAALMGSPTTKSSPLDLWGNVKIPRIEGYEEIGPANDEGWYDTRADDVDTFSSLVGIPITGIDESNYIDYITQIQTPYLSLKCSLNSSVPERTQPSEKRLPGLVSNASSPGATIYWNVPTSTDTYSLNSTQNLRDRIAPEATSPLRIRYVPLYSSNITLDCNVTSTYVETEIRCPTTSNCAASRVRRSRLNHFPSSWTMLDINWRTLRLAIKGMLKSFDGKLFYPQLFDRYLSDPNLTYSNYANVSQTTEEKYTIRLRHMLNAYFACLNGFFAITTGISSDTAYFHDKNHTFTMEREARGNLWEDLYDSTRANNTFKTKAWSADGTKVEHEDVIVAHRGWVAALCFASIVLIVASLVAPIIHHFLTAGVDLAMNISSLATRHNSCMPLPSTGTFLDASDRARFLRNQKVRFGDVHSEREVGSLAIGLFHDDGGTSVARVRKGRLYD